MSNPVIAIPSHDRREMLQRHTLQLLRRHEIDMSTVHVFASPESFYDDIAQAWGFHLHKGDESQVSITCARNDIIRHFDEGQRVVEMDDDVEDIVEFCGKNVAPVENLHKLITESFEKIGDAGLWGVCANSNAFFASGRDQVGPRSIVNSFLGYVNDKRVVLTVPEKEDFERVCIFYKNDLTVLKQGIFGVNTRYWYNAGGIQGRYNFRTRKEKQRESARQLMEMYPGFFSVHTRRNGITDVRFLPALSKPVAL